MQRSNLRVEMLGQHINVFLIGLTIGPQFNLRQHLIGEAGRHDETGVPRRAAQIDQAALGQHDQLLSIGKFNFIDLWKSEEHTSELQSLMRISYAVFCLKKKNNTNNTT